jgi:hypothetical protein|tara:strand:+ start:60 stop:188 length:129 start_codon:yes stop_codon:yes gene_type:complete
MNKYFEENLKLYNETIEILDNQKLKQEEEKIKQNGNTILKEV